MSRRALVLLAALSCAPACTPSRRHTAVDVTSGRTLRFGPAAMPNAGSFSGRYWSPQLGDLVLEQRSEQLVGHYGNELFGCSMRGRLAGRRLENRAEFTFTESYSGCANARDLSGTGFVFYADQEPNAPMVRLFGERFLPGEVLPRGLRRKPKSLGAFSAMLVPAAWPSLVAQQVNRVNQP